MAEPEHRWKLKRHGAPWWGLGPLATEKKKPGFWPGFFF
jgi:hypothetical protein